MSAPESNRDEPGTDRLILFTRYPRPGETKTRLIPAVGPEGAAAVQRELAERTFAFARMARARGRVDLEVRVTGAEPAEFEPVYGADLNFVEQGAGDLGQRLARALKEAFAAGFERAAVLGTDCPEATDVQLLQGLEALRSASAVIGPAEDGGYWLLGLERAAAGHLATLFADIEWGTDRVAEVTRARLAAAGLELTELETLADVDRPEDLERWLGSRPRTSLP